MTSQQEVRPELPEGYRIYEMDKNWYIPERWDARRNRWESWDKGDNNYHWHKTWNGAYRFLMKKIAEKQAREGE